MKAVVRMKREPVYRRGAFEAGFKRLGYTISDGSHNTDWTPEGREDVLCMWNRKHGIDEKLADTWESRGGTVVVVENAYLQRVDKSTYAISVHEHNGAGYFPVGDEDRFAKLGFDLKPPRATSEGNILVIGQRGVGSTAMASPPRWAEEAARKLQGRGTAVHVRQHPGQLPPKVPLIADLNRAGSVHIWSSSVGVRALVEGLPVIYHAPHWICAGANRDREAALHRMAYGQWTVDEISSGEPLARMQAEGWGPKTWR